MGIAVQYIEARRAQEHLTRPISCGDSTIGHTLSTNVERGAHEILF
jgi:hypothetical protein